MSNWILRNMFSIFEKTTIFLDFLTIFSSVRGHLCNLSTSQTTSICAYNEPFLYNPNPQWWIVTWFSLIILRVNVLLIFLVNICKFWQILIDIFITVLLAKNWVPYPCFWMDLNQFSFAYSSYFYIKIEKNESFSLGQTTWIGYVIKKSWPCIHFNMKFTQII